MTKQLILKYLKNRSQSNMQKETNLSHSFVECSGDLQLKTCLMYFLNACCDKNINWQQDTISAPK